MADTLWREDSEHMVVIHKMKFVLREIVFTNQGLQSATNGNGTYYLSRVV